MRTSDINKTDFQKPKPRYIIWKQYTQTQTNENMQFQLSPNIIKEPSREH